MNARRLSRLGMLAVGLGVGAAVASTPGIAAADASIDPFSFFDPSDLFGSLASVPAFDSSNISISFDGISLVQEGTAHATTTAGTGDFAFADGAGADATATGGFGNTAFADGANALGASGGSGAYFDHAVDIGNNTLGGPGFHDGAFAGDATVIDNDSTTGGTGSFDNAIDIGNNGVDAGAGGNSGAFAGAGGLIGSGGDGNGDTALEIGNLNGENLGPAAVAGNLDGASQFGDSTGTGGGALAGFGSGDLASIFGDNSNAGAGGYFDGGPVTTFGNGDIATVFGSDSTAISGASDTASGNFDLGAVFGSDLSALNAVGGNFLVDIAPFFGGNTTAAADILPSITDLGSSLGTDSSLLTGALDLLTGFSF